MENLYKEHLSKVLNSFDKILNDLEHEEIVLYSGEVKTIYSDDNTYSFKASFNFKYLAPITDFPYSFITYKINSKPKLFLFQKEDYWDSQPKKIKDFWTDYFEIIYFSKLHEINNFFKRDLSKTAILGENLQRFENLQFKSFNNQELLYELELLRTKKTPYEAACVKEANYLASLGHKAAYKAFMENKSELEVHLEYLKAIKFKESEVPYSNIVAFNENAAILHYVDYNIKNIEAKSFLLDAGACFNAYASDITRTFCKDENSEFNALIKAIDKSCLNIISKVKIDLNYEQLQEQMHLDLAKILFDFKLMNISVDEIYEKEYTKIFCPAGVGHYLGLQVHDVGNFITNKHGDFIEKSKKHPFLRLRKDIKKDNIFTIEPGIYIIEQLLRPYLNNNKFNWENIKRLKPYGGVRIEDNIYVQEEKIENFTRPYFKELDKK